MKRSLVLGLVAAALGLIASSPAKACDDAFAFGGCSSFSTFAVDDCYSSAVAFRSVPVFRQRVFVQRAFVPSFAVRQKVFVNRGFRSRSFLNLNVGGGGRRGSLVNLRIGR